MQIDMGADWGVALGEVKALSDVPEWRLAVVLESNDAGLLVGLQPKRAEVILAGACIVRTVMEKLGQSSLTVSDRGLRHGVLEERYGS